MITFKIIKKNLEKDKKSVIVNLNLFEQNGMLNILHHFIETRRKMGRLHMYM